MNRPTGASDRDGSWALDEVAHAGPEHLQRDYAAAFDAKSGTDFDEVVNDLVGLGLDATSTIVDLGAGTGAFAIAAASVARQVIAGGCFACHGRVDAESGRRSRAQECQRRPGGPHLLRSRGRAGGIVHSRNTFHQVPDFWKVMALRKVHQILRSGGILHLQDLVFSFPLEATEARVASWMDDAADDPASGWTAAEYATHLREEFSTFTWILEVMLTQTGFEVLDSWFSESGIYGGYDCRRL